MKNEYLTVSEINAYINKKLKIDANLKNIYIKGEISNYKTYPSGHSYFTLKDKKSQLSAVMFKYQKKFLKFTPENGMKVIVKGKIEVYEANGKYQLYATRITEDGVGELHIAYEQLKKRLEKEGLFDKTHKKDIPKYPKKIGVITAKTGAAIRDIITTIKRRYPICEILIFSTLVQGNMAAPQIVKQIKYAQKFNIDTLIIGRGGGSIEDLWPFNEEIVAREIYNCKIPTISAIGHEIDYTISDYVSDFRAPTPTAAAEFAVPNITNIKDKLKQYNTRLNKTINEKISMNKIKLNSITQKQIFKNPESLYEIKEMHLDSLINKLNYSHKNIITTNKNRLNNITQKQIFKTPESLYDAKRIELTNLISKLEYNYKNTITLNKHKLNKIENNFILKNPNEIIKRKKEHYLNNIDKLELLNPLLTLKRGYSIVKKDDNIIKSIEDVKKGDKLNIELEDGEINTKVI